MRERASPWLRRPWLTIALLGGGSALLAWLAGSRWLGAVIVVLGVAFAVVVALLVRLRLREGSEERLEAGLDDGRVRALRQAGDERLSGRAWLEQAFADTVATLSRSRLGAAALYELPWLLVVGATGEGKSSAIAHSGLGLADRSHAQSAVPGRDAQLWLANEAVVLDTAGRFFDRDADDLRADFDSLLALLRRHRRALPLNGVVVCLSVPTLLGLSEAALDERARLLRRRLNQIQERLGVDAPVYLLVTKADRIEGFAETTAALSHAGGEAFGWANPERRFADAGACVRDGFAALCARLDGYCARLVLGAGQAALQRRLFLFPDELSRVADAVARFAQRAFAPAQFDATPFLRGVYFASALRDGQTLSPLLDRLGAGWARMRGPASAEATFLRGVFSEVILGDAELALPTSRLGRREQRLVLALAGVASAALLVLLGVSTWFNVQGTERLAQSAARVNANRGRSLADLAALRGQIETVERDSSVLAALGIGQLDRALERAKRVYVKGFNVGFYDGARRTLLESVRRPGDAGLEALIELARDVAWLESGSDDKRAPLGRFADVAEADRERFDAGYLAFARWVVPDDGVHLGDESSALAEHSGSLLGRDSLERWSARNRDLCPAFGHADLHVPGQPGASPIPGAYTRCGWDELVRGLIETARATSLPPEQIEAFREAYLRRFSTSWEGLLMEIETSQPRADARVKASSYPGALLEIDRNTRIDALQPDEADGRDWLLALRAVLRSTPERAWLLRKIPFLGADEEPPPWARYQSLLESIGDRVDSALEDANGARALELAQDELKSQTFEKALEEVRSIVPTKIRAGTRTKLIEILQMPIRNGFCAVLDGATGAVDALWHKQIGPNPSEAALDELQQEGGRLARFQQSIAGYYEDGAAVPKLGCRMGFGDKFLDWMTSAQNAQQGRSGAAPIDVTLVGTLPTVEGDPDLYVVERVIELRCGRERERFDYYGGESDRTHTFTWTQGCQEVSLRVYAQRHGSSEGKFELQPALKPWTTKDALPNFLRDGIARRWRFPFGKVVATVPYELGEGSRRILGVVHRAPPRSVRE